MTTLTVHLPDRLSEDSRQFADEQGLTLDELTCDALETYLTEAREQSLDVQTSDQALAQIESGDAQWTDWDDVKAELDAIPR